MAENEERILVSKWSPEYMSDDKTTLISLQSQLNDKSMTYDETIEIIARALCVIDGTCDFNCSQAKCKEWECYKDDAKVILNTLLGETQWQNIVKNK